MLTITSTFFLFNEQIIMIITIMTVKVLNKYCRSRSFFAKYLLMSLKLFSNNIKVKQAMKIYIIYKYNFLIFNNAILIYSLFIVLFFAFENNFFYN